MTHFHRIRAFCNSENKFGETHAIIVDEAGKINPEERQIIATRLGLDETIFINDLVTGNVSFFDTSKEVPFAGSAALVAAWFISNHSGPIKNLACGNKSILTWQEDGLTWISTKFDIMPSWNLVNYGSPEDVTCIAMEDAKAFKHTMVWAWEDERAGKIRARTLASDWGIPEVEANGSGSMMLAASLNRTLRIRHGEGSDILAEARPDGITAIGGRAVEDGEGET